MKAITVWQPWAALLGLALKKFETRGWETKHRGPLAIHAGVNRTMVQMMFQEPFKCDLSRAGYNRSRDLVLGAVMAVGDLVACHLVTEEFVEGLNPTEKLYGDYTLGRWAWEIQDVKLVGPYPCPGKRRLWEWDGSVMDLEGVA